MASPHLLLHLLLHLLHLGLLGLLPVLLFLLLHLLLPVLQFDSTTHNLYQRLAHSFLIPTQIL